jgi:hypothetical protein
MSRAHAVAPVRGDSVRSRVTGHRVGKPGPRAVGREERQVASLHVERAMLLWPRLDRAKLRRIADDPSRIAEVVQRRTSQPYEAILAMLTRQTNAPISSTEESSGFDSGRTEAARVALRIVRSDSRKLEIRDLFPA